MVLTFEFVTIQMKATVQYFPMVLFIKPQGSTFRKGILGPAGPYVFIFGHQDKYSSRHKLSSRKNRIQCTKGLLMNPQKIVNKLQKVEISLAYAFPKKVTNISGASLATRRENLVATE